MSLKALKGAALPDQTLEVDNPTGAVGFIPEKNGMINIEHNPNKRYSFTYGYAQNLGSTIVLHDLKKAPDADYVGSSVNINQNDDVVFKKFILLKSNGEMGGSPGSLTTAHKSVNFFTPITDALQEDEPTIFTLQNKDDFKQWNTSEFGSKDLEVGTYQTSGGGTNLYASFKKVPIRDNRYGYGSICLNKPEDFTKNWLTNQRKLNYDAQVKIGTGNEMMHGAAGITLRNTTNGRIGVSFLKYFSPFIPYVSTGRTVPLHDGDTVKGVTSLATAVVVGEPLLTRGSWAGGNAQGEFRVTNVVGTFTDKGEPLLVGSEAVSNIRLFNDGTYRANYRDSVFEDLIPSEIKPSGNGQDILIVIWEEKGERATRQSSAMVGL